ncbi:nitroreductase family protein [Kutzneria sp. CA-103260]|uniref:nitroreductase family protein n=1 Tax=Kutzneria sp. CA-103260 TaxID=2802641 RepID=UPI001BAAA156|nr:nitroreductase family protein [Kutzneria sp. CA-103260]QUQ69761.1 nitroreductase family protein [Kutzneria sp. CA-103260]
MHPLISERWSPRALDPAAKITDAQLESLFEAARWAASSGNTQPARWLVGRRGDASFQQIFDALRPGNQSWAGAASALLVGCVVTEDETGRTLPMPDYALGLSAQNLVLQAVAEGLVAHQMGGFSREAVATSFGLPATAQAVVAIAVGTLGAPSLLPEDLAARETAPRVRKPLSELVFTENWGSAAF